MSLPVRMAISKVNCAHTLKYRDRILKSGIRSQNCCVRFADEFDFLVFYQNPRLRFA